MSSSSYSYYNPNLCLSGEYIAVIPEEGFRYLGVLINPSLSELSSRNLIKESLLDNMNLVNNTCIAKTDVQSSYYTTPVMVVHYLRPLSVFCKLSALSGFAFFEEMVWPS